LRTAFESLINPVAVARAALRSETDRYVSPIRVFVFLYGLLLAASAFFLDDQFLSLDSIAGGEPDDYAVWLAGTDLSFEAVDDTVKFWMNLAIWPITIIATLAYVLVLKLYRPKRTLYGHLLVYLVANNGPAFLQIILMLALVTVLNFGASAFISTGVLLIAYSCGHVAVVVGALCRDDFGRTAEIRCHPHPFAPHFRDLGRLGVLISHLILQLGYGLSLFSLLDIIAGATP
jgi:hypothetical protein